MFYKKIANDLKTYIYGAKLYKYVDVDLLMYPIDLLFTLDNVSYYYEPFDRNGIPMKRYLSVGEQYNPTRICSYALANYNLFRLYGDKSHLKLFFDMANWLLESEDGIWKYNFNWETLPNPWASCMAQGEGISVLVRAYLESGDERYAIHATKALNILDIQIKDGGVGSLIDGIHPFLEEYPEQEPSHVLNGFLYCLIGLIDYHQHIKEIALVPQMCDSLDKILRMWQIGRWSRYDLHNSGKLVNAATPIYHQIHISQLRAINKYMKSPNIEFIADEWESGSKSILTRLSAFIAKTRYRTANSAQR